MLLLYSQNLMVFFNRHNPWHIQAVHCRWYHRWEKNSRRKVAPYSLVDILDSCFAFIYLFTDQPTIPPATNPTIAPSLTPTRKPCSPLIGKYSALWFFIFIFFYLHACQIYCISFKADQFTSNVTGTKIITPKTQSILAIL